MSVSSHTPCVVMGFEPLDILQGIAMLVEQVEAGEAKVEIQYRRAVNPQGNPNALKTMDRVFEPGDAPWRGLGTIPASGLVLRPAYQAYDAAERFGVRVGPGHEKRGCLCGEIVKGKLLPDACPLYGTACRPESPVGPCMVSAEGTCAAHFKYSRLK